MGCRIIDSTVSGIDEYLDKMRLWARNNGIKYNSDEELISEFINDEDRENYLLNSIKVKLRFESSYLWYSELLSWVGNPQELIPKVVENVENREFNVSDFLFFDDIVELITVCDYLNKYRYYYLNSENDDDKIKSLYKIISLLPVSYVVSDTVLLTYRQVKGMYYYFENSPIYEWDKFRKYINNLPIFSIILGM